VIDILVTGAGGALGSVLMRVLSEAHEHCYGLISPHGPAPDVGKVLRVDLRDPQSFRERVLGLSPRVIIHLAAISKPSDVLRDPDLAHALNVDATATLVELSTRMGSRFIYASTDMVFDGGVFDADGDGGASAAPYTEQHATEPGTLYGRTKLLGECYAMGYARSLIVRLPLMYGLPEASRAPTFFQTMLSALQAGQPIHLFEDELRSPLWLEDAAHALLRLAHDKLTGVLHVPGPEALSRLHMGQKLAAALGCSDAPLIAAKSAALGGLEPRPRDLRLDDTRYRTLFGAPAGRDMHTALPLLLARGPHRLLS
jgi:dTDP-4-dehydrorhamnose reductase